MQYGYWYSLEFSQMGILSLIKICFDSYLYNQVADGFFIGKYWLGTVFLISYWSVFPLGDCPCSTTKKTCALKNKIYEE